MTTPNFRTNKTIAQNATDAGVPKDAAARLTVASHADKMRKSQISGEPAAFTIVNHGKILPLTGAEMREFLRENVVSAEAGVRYQPKQPNRQSISRILAWDKTRVGAEGGVTITSKRGLRLHLTIRDMLSLIHEKFTWCGEIAPEVTPATGVLRVIRNVPTTDQEWAALGVRPSQVKNGDVFFSIASNFVQHPFYLDDQGRERNGREGMFWNSKVTGEWLLPNSFKDVLGDEQPVEGMVLSRTLEDGTEVDYTYSRGRITTTNLNYYSVERILWGAGAAIRIKRQGAPAYTVGVVPMRFLLLQALGLPTEKAEDGTYALDIKFEVPRSRKGTMGRVRSVREEVMAGLPDENEASGGNPVYDGEDGVGASMNDEGELLLVGGEPKPFESDEDIPF